MEYLGSAFVVIVLVAVVGLIIRYLVKQKKAGGGCSGNCAGCSGCKGCH